MLRLARVLGRPQRAPELLLAAIRVGDRQVAELARPAPRRLDGERRVGGDRVGRVERHREEILGQDDRVHEADRARVLESRSINAVKRSACACTHGICRGSSTVALPVG